MGIEFNLPSFGAGIVTGVAGSAAAYRINKAVQNWRESQQYRAQRPRVQGSVEGDGAYNRALVDAAQSAHLFGHRVPLTNILVEPRFIRPLDLVTIPKEDEPTDVFDNVPRVHDYPYLHAPYNMPTLSIDELSRSDRLLTLVGVPGSGRTTALMTIALWSFGEVEFEVPSDSVQAYLKEQEEELSPDEQAERIKTRVALSEQGRQRYAEMKEGVETDDLADPTAERISYYREIAPLYIHLCDVLPHTDEYGRNIDPAEPIIRALQQQVGWYNAKRMVNKQYNLLKAGKALVLIDGYDDVPPTDRSAIRGWLQAFVEMYGENVIIVAAPPEGYGLLKEQGAVPIYLRPWNDQMIRDYVNKLAAAWEPLTGQAEIHIPQPDAPQGDDGQYVQPVELEEYLAEIMPELRGMSAQELTLYIWQRLLRKEALHPHELWQAYLNERFPDAQSVQPELERMAVMQHDTGYITRQQLVDDRVEEEMAKIGVMPASNGATNSNATSTATADADDVPEEVEAAFFSEDTSNDDALNALFDESDDTPETTATTATTATMNSTGGMTEEELEAEEKRLRKEFDKQWKQLISALVEAEILLPHRRGRYRLRHSELAAFVAAHALADADETTLLAKYALPGWKPAMPHLAAVCDVDVLVAEQLSQPLDVRHSHLLELTRWLKYAGKDVQWRSPLLKYLGNLMVAPHQYTLVRERIAAALVSSRDEGALVIFRRAFRERNPDVRKVAALSVGALRDAPGIDRLSEIALNAEEVSVAIAAVLAISAIGTEDALYTLVEVLQLSNREDVRRAIAEELASNREEGYMTLYDAKRAEDMMLRRAAVFGLGRVPADWALIELNETFLEDDEWYVRSAAEVVFKDIYEGSLGGVHAYPEPTEAPWLQEWADEAVERGDIPHNLDGMPLFERAFAMKQDPLIRLLATATIGQTGFYEKVDEVYHALRDQQEAIRDAAYRALGEIQEQLGEPLPAPNSHQA